MMVERMDDQLDSVWTILESNLKSGENSESRIYRRLDLKNESGLRLGVITPGNFRELLIQIDKNDDYSFNPPKWVGMRFNIITLDVPEEGIRHISLYLEDPEHNRVFTMVCSDIAETLSRMDSASHRTQELKAILDQWTRFFKFFGPDGLSPMGQRGLYGELTWLELLLETDMDMSVLVESWQGFKRAYYDFELNGRVVEVKTTMTKEPRRVRINNERQLDDRGLDSLYLYVLTLHKLETGGEMLPELVDKIRKTLKHNSLASNAFDRSLKKAGYFDFHAHNYTSGYVRKKQEIFHVSNGFPRVIDFSAGVGDISYSITISACSSFLVDLNSAVTSFTGE